MKICTAAQMRFMDATTIAEDLVPGLELMENAGKGTVDLMLDYYGDCKGRRVAIFAGPGNNGGDGYVMARHLHELGAEVTVYLLVAPDRIAGDAATNFNRLAADMSVVPLTGEEDIDSIELHHDLLVDALLGTGLSREVTGIFAKVIERINAAGQPVIAVDIPSGLNADTGTLWGCCVHADLTVTYGLAKAGLVQYPGADYVGQLEVVDIGIPAAVMERAVIQADYLRDEEAACLLPERNAMGHKGSHGHALLIAGSRGKTGAAVLAADGALRSGAGLVSLVVPERLNTIFEVHCLEAMTIPVAGVDGYCLGNNDYTDIAQAARGKRCLVIGPGLGSAPSTTALVNQLVREMPLSLVLDADALVGLEPQALGACPERRDCLITPHPGEMSRLTGLSTTEVQDNRVQVAADFATQHGVIVVLKGAATVIAEPRGRVAINSSGNNGMGTGGMGDVLAGVIGGLLAQGLQGFEAACLAVYAHGRAGDLLAETGPYGYLASELSNLLPQVWAELQLLG